MPAAYCSSSNVELPFSASAIDLAPSASILFTFILQEGLKHKKHRRQGALTVGREASGSIPNAGEGGVRLEEVLP